MAQVRPGALPRSAWIVGALLLAFVGCGAEGRSREAAAAARPHLAHFARYDAWARRTLGADPALREPAQILETMFAPLRLESQVRDAWVLRRGPGERTIGFRSPAPPEVGWTDVRDASLGELRVATDVSLPRGSNSAPALLVARRRTLEDGATVEVVVAYAVAR